MKLIKKLSKRTRIVSLMIILVIGSATTIAFLQNYSEMLINTFTLKSIHTEIEENNHNTTLTKMPFVKNTDVTDVMVRVRLDISGDFSNFALAGIDGNYVVGSDINSSDLLNEGITFIECGTYTTKNKTSEFWTCESDDDKYSCYYYYKRVLKSEGYKDDNGNPLDVTQPVFDRILLRYKMNDGSEKLISYKDAQNTETYPNALKMFEELKNVTITIYQESVPVVLYDGDTKYDADQNKDNIIDTNPTDAKYIWEYFMSNQNGE